MPTLDDLLKANPYQFLETNPTYISPNDFYNENDGVYVLAKDCSDIETFFYENSHHAKILRLNGYAGCGKTMFAHYLIWKYGFDEQYYYEFDEDEGENYDLDDVIDLLTESFSYELAKLIKKNAGTSEFKGLGKQFFTNKPLSAGMHALFSPSGSAAIELHQAELISSAELPEIAEQVQKALQQSFFSIQNTIDQKSNEQGQVLETLKKISILSFLLILDFLLRHTLILASTNRQPTSSINADNRVVFCLLDNLDNLRRDVIADLYCAILGVTEQINGFFLKKQNSGTHFSTSFRIVYLFPTRAVTNQKLRDELRYRGQEKYLKRRGITHFTELSLSSDIHGHIIQKRLHYWVKHDLITSDQKTVFSNIESLIKTRFASGNFSALFNNNYSLCVDRILDFYEKSNEWGNLSKPFLSKLSNECVEPLFSLNTLSKNDPNNRHLRNAVEDAQKGIFLRILLEIMKEGSAYASPLDLNSKNHFQVCSKLGLVPLVSSPIKPDNGVSLSRLILTYLRSKGDPYVAYLNELFECFDAFDPEDICRCVYALSENIRDVWRRLVMFNRTIPSGIEDLYKQAEDFKCKKATNYTEIQLCRAGEEYLMVVAPSFEFFLSRLDQVRNNLDLYPPLFSSFSIKSGTWKHSISAVLQAVEQCALQLYQYDISMIDSLIDRNKANSIQHLFASSRKSDGVKQTHLSRIIFSHISYIEHFRVFYLFYWSQNDREEKIKPMAERVADNERIISYIIRYLTLFRSGWTDDEKYLPLLNNQFLPWDNNKPSHGNNDCYSVYLHLQKTGYITKGIENGFLSQNTAQSTLLDEILQIHSLHYSSKSFLIPIYINKKTSSHHSR